MAIGCVLSAVTTSLRETHSAVNVDAGNQAEVEAMAAEAREAEAREGTAAGTWRRCSIR